MPAMASAAALDRDGYVPMPIPAGWIRAGRPEARGKVVLSSPDRLQHLGEWECSAGTFHFHFDYHESIRILEGEVSISDPSGRVRKLVPGDFAHFPLGLDTTWVVERYVRKAFFLVTPEPWP